MQRHSPFSHAATLEACCGRLPAPRPQVTVLPMVFGLLSVISIGHKPYWEKAGGFLLFSAHECGRRGPGCRMYVLCSESLLDISAVDPTIYGMSQEGMEADKLLPNDCRRCSGRPDMSKVGLYQSTEQNASSAVDVPGRAHPVECSSWSI